MPVLGEQQLNSELLRIPGLLLLPNEPLARHTRFALGGPARLLLDASTVPALDAALSTLRDSGHPFFLIGGGTNLIVSDEGYDGVILRFQDRTLRVSEHRLSVGSGAELEDVVDASIAAGLAGMECLKRIPGWTGAAIYGNAGAYGQQIGDGLVSVTFHDGESVRTWDAAACGFRYRWSRFKDHRDWVILGAEFGLHSGDRAALAARAEEIRSIRDDKFPPALRCAGSIFKNFILAELPAEAQQRVPAAMVKGGKVPAAWFLEQVGAKGLSTGGIHVADYHANLLYNDGRGTAAELIEVIDELKARLQREFAIPLEEEVQYVGFADRASY